MPGSGFTTIDQPRYDAGIVEARNRALKDLQADADKFNASIQKCAEQATTESGDYDYDKLTEVAGGSPAEKLKSLIDLHTDFAIVNDALNEKKAFIEKANRIKSGSPAIGMLGDIDMNALVDAVRKADTELTRANTLPRLSDEVKKALGDESYRSAMGAKRELDLPELPGRSILNTLFEHGTSGAGKNEGWETHLNVRPGFIEHIYHPLQVIDFLPRGETSQNAIAYYIETVFGKKAPNSGQTAAVERVEAEVLAEAEFRYEKTTEPVVSIGAQIPITMEQLEDEPAVRRILDQRMGLQVNMRLDKQILNGDNSSSAENLNGLLNRAGIQTYAKQSAEKGFNALLKARRQVKLVGRAMAGGYLMHDNDWTDMQLLESTAGGYYLGNPREYFGDRIWGAPVALTDHLPEGTAMVGDWAQFTELTIRHGVRVEFGRGSDDFQRLQERIRAYMRVALCLFRPKALVKITGL